MSQLVLAAGVAVTALGVGLAGLALAPLVHARQQVSRSLAVLSAGSSAVTAPQLPLTQRVLLPALDDLAGLGHRLTPAAAVERMQRQLDLAGNPGHWTIRRVLAVKAGGLLMAVLVALWLTTAGGSTGVRPLLVAALAGAAGFFLPDLLVYNAGTKRQALIQKDLADAMDLLTISVESGLGFDAALVQVARNTEGPVSGEFFRTLQEMQIGRSRAEALRSLGERTTVADLRTFVGAVVQADSLGIPIARVLREQSKEMRLKRRQRAEEKAMKVPVKVLFPTVVLILPVIFVVILAPAAIGLSQKL